MATTKLPNEYLELLKSFTGEEVEFLLVGGWAVISHGYVRYTKDIDLWVAPDPSNATSVLRALDLLGYEMRLDAIQLLQTEHSVFRLGQKPLLIDIMTSCDGCKWSAAWSRRQIIDIDGIPVPVISLQDLRAAKLAAGRHRDLDDLENLPPAP